MLSVARAGDGGCDVPGVDGLDAEEAALELDIVLGVLQILYVRIVGVITRFAVWSAIR